MTSAILFHLVQLAPLLGRMGINARPNTLKCEDLPMSFDDRIAAVDVATKFQESSEGVFQMVQEETEFAKTQYSSRKGKINSNNQTPPLQNPKFSPTRAESKAPGPLSLLVRRRRGAARTRRSKHWNRPSRRRRHSRPRWRRHTLRRRPHSWQHRRRRSPHHLRRRRSNRANAKRLRRWRHPWAARHRGWHARSSSHLRHRRPRQGRGRLVRDRRSLRLHHAGSRRVRDRRSLRLHHAGGRRVRDRRSLRLHHAGGRRVRDQRSLRLHHAGGRRVRDWRNLRLHHTGRTRQGARPAKGTTPPCPLCNRTPSLCLASCLLPFPCYTVTSI
ncbi:Magnesium-chelatase subunit [Nymphaea thermarum]|nr:Magnesium-chelatase subunit [Nymphaea thermarum]